MILVKPKLKEDKLFDNVLIDRDDRRVGNFSNFIFPQIIMGFVVLEDLFTVHLFPDRGDELCEYAQGFHLYVVTK